MKPAPADYERQRRWLAWAASPQGQQAIQQGLAEAERLCSRLRQAQQLSQQAWREPMTV